MVIYVVLAAVATVVIALVAVGREAFTLGFRPKEALFDLDEAVDYVAERLPFEVSARLSYEDVRRILVWHLDYLAAKDVPPDAASAVAGTGPVVVEDDESVAYILGRDDELSADDVFAVVQGGHAYLSAIGAVGGEVPGPPDV